MAQEKEFHVYTAFSGVGGLGGPITSTVVIFAGYREQGGDSARRYHQQIAEIWRNFVNTSYISEYLGISAYSRG
jgi:hypothetical protein